MIVEISDDLVDTYGGDYTYRKVWGEFEGEWTFYHQYYGAKPSDTEIIDDPEELIELLEAVNNIK